MATVGTGRRVDGGDLTFGIPAEPSRECWLLTAEGVGSGARRKRTREEKATGAEGVFSG